MKEYKLDLMTFEKKNQLYKALRLAKGYGIVIPDSFNNWLNKFEVELVLKEYNDKRFERVEFKALGQEQNIT